MDRIRPLSEQEYAVAVVIMIVSVMILFMVMEEPTLTWEPYYNRDRERENYVARILRESDENCIAMLRMNRSTFLKLCDMLRTKRLLWDSIHISVEEQIGMFLHIVGHNQRNRVIAVNFIRSGETISRYFKHVLHAIGELRGLFLKPPSISVHWKIANNPTRMSFFKDCIGALDGTHIQASLLFSMVAPFRGRKSFPTQNVLAAVDFDFKFTYVLAGWEGSAHDALVLRNALERRWIACARK